MAYREHAPPDGLGAHVACLWTAGDGATRVLPDACADIVLTEGELVVAGPTTRTHLAPATPGAPRVGLRFRVGCAGAALGVPAHELRDEDVVALTDLWGAPARRLADRVLAAPDPLAAAHALARGVAAREPAPEGGDRAVRAAVVALAADPATPLPALGRAAGLSERQLRRRFEAAVGYGPATLARVLRFQRFLTLARDPGPVPTLARLAADAGYADQAHLARETRRLAGRTPSALLVAGAGPAGERGLSGMFKAPERRSATLAA